MKAATKPATKKANKKCPKCKFACWVDARICQKCGYDFVLQRMPRKAHVVLEDLDDLLDDEVPEPVTAPALPSKKECPLCKHQNFHRAPHCEKCKNWDFLRQVEINKAKKKDETEVPDDGPTAPPEEKRVAMGYIPNFARIKHEAWMDEYDGSGNAALRSWASNFLYQMRTVLKQEEVHSSFLASYAARSSNPHLRNAVRQLEEWYNPSIGISEWRFVGDALKGEMLTGPEQTAAWAQVADLRNKVSVQRRLKHANGEGFTYLSFMTADEAEKVRDEEAKKGEVYFSATLWGGQKALRLLPDNYHQMSDTDVKSWLYQTMTVPDGELPPRIPPVPTVKVSKRKAS